MNHCIDSAPVGRLSEETGGGAGGAGEGVRPRVLSVPESGGGHFHPW